jgi:hypothetical protein
MHGTLKRAVGLLVRLLDVFLNFLLHKQVIERVQKRVESRLRILPLSSIGRQVHIRLSSSHILSTAEQVHQLCARSVLDRYTWNLAGGLSAELLEKILILMARFRTEDEVAQGCPRPCCLIGTQICF